MIFRQSWCLSVSLCVRRVCFGLFFDPPHYSWLCGKPSGFPSIVVFERVIACASCVFRLVLFFSTPRIVFWSSWPDQARACGCLSRSQVVVQYHKPIEASEIKSRDGLSRRLRQASRKKVNEQDGTTRFWFTWTYDMTNDREVFPLSLLSSECTFTLRSSVPLDSLRVQYL